MSVLTAEQSDLVRGAAFGAMALVSKADPGFFAMFKESMAGAKALAAAPSEIRELLGGGFVAPPSGAAQDLEGAVVSQLQQARDMLAVTAPELLDGFRGVVLAACQATAQADDGVSDSERATIAPSRTCCPPEAVRRSCPVTLVPRVRLARLRMRMDPSRRLTPRGPARPTTRAPSSAPVSRRATRRRP